MKIKHTLLKTDEAKYKDWSFNCKGIVPAVKIEIVW